MNAAALKKMRACEALFDSPVEGERVAARAAHARLAEKYGQAPSAAGPSDIRYKERAAAYRDAVERSAYSAPPRKAGRTPADQQEALADWFYERDYMLDRDRSGRWWVFDERGQPILKSASWDRVTLLATACGWTGEGQ